MTSTKYFRADIQGLRALAVCLIIVFHVWPSLLTGGYIGVDVFFVISGFLITKHILKEVSITGTVSLTRFWARRIRRLLPAALFVLFSSILLTTALLPSHVWNQTFQEIIASAFYVENWALVANSVDYLAVENEPTLVQHFWSLSVEEQFYIVWPLFILLLITLTKSQNINVKSSCSNPDIKNNNVIKYGLLSIFIISLTYSTYTMKDGGQAYFSTATRAWEFSLGGLLIFIPDRTPDLLSVCWYQTAKAVASWVGFILIIFSAITFSSETDFPGYIALFPTIGTSIIILSRCEHIHWSFSAMTRFKPIQFVGGVSYSAYLWHWPLVIICPLIFVNVSDPKILGIIIIGSTIIFSWLSKNGIEDQALKNNTLINKPRYSFLFASIGMVLIILVVGIFHKKNEPRIPGLTNFNNQFSSVDEIQRKLTETLSSDSWQEVDQKPGKNAQVPEWVVDDCMDIKINNHKSMEKCVYGNPKAKKTLVVIGDSWATHFLPAIRQAFSPGWRVQVLTLSQCPISDVKVHKWNDKNEFIECNKHREDTIRWIASNNPNLVISSDSAISTAQRLMSKASGIEATQEIRKGLLKSYQLINDTGVKVIHLESPPRITCRSEEVDTPKRCESNLSATFQRRISEAKISVAEKMGFKVVDTTFWACSPGLVCPNQIEKVLLKADSGHFTGNFSRKLGNVLHDEIFK